MNVIPEQPETGPGLSDLSRSGGARQTIRLAEPTPMKRAEFFFATPGPYPTASFGFMLTDPAQRNYVSREFIVCNLKRVTVPGESGVVLQDGLVVPDTLHHINPWARGSLLATFEPGRSVRFNRPLVVMHNATRGSYFVGFTGSWRNYAHWLQESLPKLTAFVEMRRTRPELKLVVPKFLPGSFHQQTLTLLGITRAMVFPLEFEDVITFDDAWVASHPDIWSVPPYVAAAARQLATGVVQQFASDEPGGGGQGDRIYVHRRDTIRCVANFTEVEALVKRHGFTVVSPEEYPVAQQIAIMQRARCVIAEHGAGAANILFCRPGASVLELFNPSSVQPAYWSVASACELRFGFVVGEHVSGDRIIEPNWNSNYIIPLQALELALARMTEVDSDRLPSDLRSPHSIAHPKTCGLNKPCPEIVETALSNLSYTSANEFSIGDIHFVLAAAATETSADRILVFKDRGFVDSYAETLPCLGVRRAFEFGIYQGGSAIFLTSLLDLEKFVCIDLSLPVLGFQEALAKTGLDSRIKPHYGVLQDDSTAIKKILETEFNDGLPDLIIDDASHLYEKTKRSFEIAFPYLKDGGYYIIEDWSWAHWPENQDVTEGWTAGPATTNFIIELMVLLPSRDMIEWISVRQGYVIIKKRHGLGGTDELNVSALLRTRHRSLPQL